MDRELTITLSAHDLELLVEALDSHEYWQLGYDLPRKNGFELCREIKGRPEGKGIPILLMSAAYNDHDQSNRTIQLGTLADGYLTKPFDLVALLAQVKHLLGEA